MGFTLSFPTCRHHTISAAQDRLTSQNVVIKTFFKQRLTGTARARLDAEIQHLQQLSGVPGVVRYVSHYEDDEAVNVVLERGPGKLRGRLAPFSRVSDCSRPGNLVLSQRCGTQPRPPGKALRPALCPQA
jgi:hypothetical protein